MTTRRYKQLKLLLCSIFISTSLSTPSHAFIPVVDAGTLAQTVTNNLNMVLELKSVKNIINLAGTMNTTIGNALSTFNEYVTTYYAYKEQFDEMINVAGQATQIIDVTLGTDLSEIVHDVEKLGEQADQFVSEGSSSINNYGNMGLEGTGYGMGASGYIGEFGDLIEGEIKNLTGDPANQSGGGTGVGGGSGASSGGISTQSPTRGAGLTATLTGPGTNNGFSILPNELADFCNLKASDISSLKDKPKVVECLKKLITLRNHKDKDAQRVARDVYVKAFHETAYANIAEAVVMRNYAVNYERQVLEPLTKKLKEAKTVRDDYSGVIMVNKEVANLINKLLMIYSSKVAYEAFSDYGDFEISSEDILNIGDN